MRLKNALLAAVALAAAGCGQPKSNPGQPLARIGDQSVTWADLNKAFQEENKDKDGGTLDAHLAQLDLQDQMQVYQAKRQALDQFVQKRIFEAQAKKEGVGSAEELMKKKQQEIAAKIPDPPDAQVQALYDQAKANGQQLPPIEQIKGDIVMYMKQPKMRDELVNYFDTLKKEQNVKVLLLPPRIEVDATGPAKGPKSAPITIVEFSDFQCPYCIQAEKTVEEVLKAYPDKIRLVYRDFPLPMHPLAPKAAEASHCAETQGKYWEMHDKMFAADGKIEVPDLKKYAREVGMDGDKFDKCLDGGEMAKAVKEHQDAGSKLGVTGTPAFFINGRALTGAQPIEEFKAIIDAELAKK